MRTVIDVSLDIAPDMLTWPGDPAVTVEPTSRIERGDDANVSHLGLGTHTGTHIDPPFHFIPGGSTVDRIPLDTLIGDAWVADARGLSGALRAEDLEGLSIPAGVSRLVLRSDNSVLWRARPARFPDDYVCLSPSGAAWVVERGIRLVGVDFLSVEARHAPGHPVHTTLLEAGIVIVEGLDLFQVEAGAYTFACLPLKIVGGDGAPARAVLMR